MKQLKTQPLRIVRGTTNLIELTLTNAAGEPLALPDGAILRLGVKQARTCTDCCITKEITDGNISGVYIFTLKPEDTENLPCGHFYYDIGLQVGDDYFTVVEVSPFEIAHNITGREV